MEFLLISGFNNPILEKDIWFLNLELTTVIMM